VRGGNIGEIPSGRWAVGALLDRQLGEGYALEGSFLLRRYGERERNLGMSGVRSEKTALIWDVPLLFRLAPVRWGGRWTLGAGPAVQLASHQEWRLAGRATEPLAFLRSSGGLAAAAGRRWNAGPVVLRAEIRYHWFARGLQESSERQLPEHRIWLVVGAGR
jgi:hypothetical protein